MDQDPLQLLQDRFADRLNDPARATWKPGPGGLLVCLVQGGQYSFDSRARVLYYTEQGRMRPEPLERGVPDIGEAKRLAARHYVNRTPNSFHRRERHGSIRARVWAVVKPTRR